MSGSRPRPVAGALLAWLALFSAGASAAGYAGRPIADVLAELRGPGLDFIYSSDLLPPSLTVVAEPDSTNRLVVAREILAARGLALRAIRPGLFAVTEPATPIPEARVTGVVRDDAGRPVEHALVRLDPVQAA